MPRTRVTGLLKRYKPLLKEGPLKGAPEPLKLRGPPWELRGCGVVELYPSLGKSAFLPLAENKIPPPPKGGRGAFKGHEAVVEEAVVEEAVAEEAVAEEAVVEEAVVVEGL